MTYATADQLALWMGRGANPFTEAETARAELLLESATGAIDDETGQSLTVATTTVQLEGTGTARLVLPRWPVTAVAAVVVDGEDLAAEHYRWTGSGVLRNLCGVWPRGALVTVTEIAGWDPVPASVRALCLELAAGSWNNPDAKRSERLADYQVAWQRLGMRLSTQDRADLAQYRANSNT